MSRTYERRRTEKHFASSKQGHSKLAYLRAGDENWHKGCVTCGSYPSIYRPHQPALCRVCSKGGAR